MSIKINNQVKPRNLYRRELVPNLPFIASFTDNDGRGWVKVPAISPIYSNSELIIIGETQITLVSVDPDYVIWDYTPMSLVINVCDLDITIAL